MTFHHNNYNARVRLYTELFKSLKNFFKNFKTFEIPQNHLMSKPEIEMTFAPTHLKRVLKGLKKLINF